MSPTDLFIYWTGVLTIFVSTVPTFGLILWFGAKIVDRLCNRLWEKLRALHNLKVLQEELTRLELQGKLWHRLGEQEED